MKYMGSKRAMLRNGLGELIQQELRTSTRFVDLFSGSGAVAAFVATRTKLPVLAIDLQQYTTVLNAAILLRKEQLNAQQIWKSWRKRAKHFVSKYKMPISQPASPEIVRANRNWSTRQVNLPITFAYGGHYYSAYQAIWLDALLATLPKSEPMRAAAHAALIQAASQCAAAPGHTAQPFQPTRTAKRFLAEAWSRSIPNVTRKALAALSLVHAEQIGEVRTADANSVVSEIRETDLVFVDPPYSGVHYSRFYHVLETIARGEVEEVSGVGRYPNSNRRPRSRYSVKSEAFAALDELLRGVAEKGATIILTFPEHVCSNGLSGLKVREIALRHFDVVEQTVKSKFSTLGGANKPERQFHRPARHDRSELILLLRPPSYPKSSGASGCGSGV